MKEGRHNGVNVKYFCTAFKQFNIIPGASSPAYARNQQDKKREMCLNISQKLPFGKQMKKQTATAIGLLQNILRTSVDTLDEGDTIHAPRHD
jgi:hypothetical protein